MKRMKSDQVRTGWRDVLDAVQGGESVIVERYNRPIAQVIPQDDTIVVLRASDPVQAERLRRLVAEHGAVGMPFPNNAAPGWRIVDEDGQPVNTHSIPAAPVSLVS